MEFATGDADMRGSTRAVKPHISRHSRPSASTSPPVARRVIMGVLYHRHFRAVVAYSPAMKPAALWLGAFVGVSAALVFLYPDSYQQDGGTHFLFARWAWVHPELLVGVWSRPAFTLLYSFPAQFGYPVAKLFTVAVAAGCAWHTWRLAVELKIPRPSLALPLLFLQPSFFQLASDTLTEP